MAKFCGRRRPLGTNKRYRVTLEEDARAAAPRQDEVIPYPLSELLGAAADLGVADPAERHDRYARRSLRTSRSIA